MRFNVDIAAFDRLSEPFAADLRQAWRPAGGQLAQSHCAIAILAAFDASAKKRLFELCRTCRVVVVIHPDATLAYRAKSEILRSGASDVVDWQSLAQLLDQLTARLERWREIDALADDKAICGQVVGVGRLWRSIVRDVIEIAAFSQSHVLLLGETGTGKEQIAGLVHRLAERDGARSFATVDCTTLTPELAGSELFGHERGAYTGAANARDGAVALAHDGILFLDEIGDLPLPLQAQLLRVIQEGMFKRIGSNVWQRSRFRVVAATNRDLDACVRQGTFRADLYFRISDCVVRLPALRDRREDILPLVEHFLGDSDGSSLGIDNALRDYLVSRDYPGNVRELRRLVLALKARHAGPGPITIGALARNEWLSSEADVDSGPWDLEPGFVGAITRAINDGVGLKEIGRIATDTATRVAIEQEDGNLQRAARRLGVTDRALQMRRANGNGDGGGRDPPH